MTLPTFVRVYFICLRSSYFSNCKATRTKTKKWVKQFALQWRHISVMAPQITGDSTVYSTVYLGEKERNNKGPHYCSLWGVAIRFPTQRENVSVSWRHHGTPGKGEKWNHKADEIVASGCALRRDQFVYALIQWETMLQCNVVSHWLGAYTKDPWLGSVQVMPSWAIWRNETLQSNKIWLYNHKKTAQQNN